jgi:hypothetical protein
VNEKWQQEKGWILGVSDRKRRTNRVECFANEPKNKSEKKKKNANFREKSILHLSAIENEKSDVFVGTRGEKISKINSLNDLLL